MRRQHNNVSSTPPGPTPGIPFAEDLIFYAPLTEGDLTDHISGVTGTNNGGNITWNSTKQMYFIQSAATGGASFPGGLKFVGTENINGPFTMYAQVETTYAGYNGSAYGCYVTVLNSSKYVYLATYEVNGLNNDLTVGKVAYSFDFNTNPNSKLYLNGTLTYSKNSGATNSAIFNEVHVGGLGNNNYSLDFYVKDVRIYKRALSASEIQYIVNNPYVPQEPPIAPTNVTASMQSGGVLVSWNTSAAATSYKVYRSNSSSGTYTLLSTQNSVSYMDQSPLSGYNYYKIIASNEHGDSDYSSAASVNFVAPSTPTGLNGIKSGNYIILSWSEVSNAVSYKIYRCATAGGTYVHYDNTSLTNYTDTSPLTGDNYYKVSAYNAAGESALSSYIYIDNSGGGGVDVTTPFFCEDFSGQANTVTIKRISTSAAALAVEYSTDMVNWISMGTTNSSGISATIPANGRLYLRCTTSRWGYNDSSYNNIIASGYYKVGGNILSLLRGSSFNANTNFSSSDLGRTFSCIFRNPYGDNTTLLGAPDLILPQNVISSCYNRMFSSCTSFTEPPVLPAMTMVSNCYVAMFISCSSLEIAPDLPALSLGSSNTWCYDSMFRNCSKLKYVKAMFLTTPNSNYTGHWMESVSATGTFVKNINATWSATGGSAVPSGWTIEYASS